MTKTEQNKIEDLNYVKAVLATRAAGYKYRTNKATAHAIVRNGLFFYNGRDCRAICKSVGAGVYEVWLES